MFRDEELIRQVIEKVAIDLSEVPGNTYTKKLKYLLETPKERDKILKMNAQDLYDFFIKIVTDGQSTLSRAKQQYYLDQVKAAYDMYYPKYQKRLVDKIYFLLYGPFLKGLGMGADIGVTTSIADEILKEAEINEVI